MMNICLDK